MLVGILLISTVFYFFAPSENSFYPSCIFKNITGLSCPGCGSQRAFHELLHLKFKVAFTSNPLFVLAIPYGLALLISAKIENENARKIFKILTGKRAFFLISTVIIAYFIWRNL
ncbi:DUF2752 domain-containing protein [Kaistella solincola]|nr:DUF2752 domain-containing protein [Kaistella solincola]